MTSTHRIAIVAIVSCLTACRGAPSCALAGDWNVAQLSCSSSPDDRTAGMQATYTFEGEHGHTQWRMPGCTVEARFDVKVNGETVRIREHHHECKVTQVVEGAEAIPCCESSAVNLDLSYTCKGTGETSTWTATLEEDGATGPWAGRGAWRGCRAGDVATMRLQRR